MASMRCEGMALQRLVPLEVVAEFRRLGVLFLAIEHLAGDGGLFLIKLAQRGTGFSAVTDALGDDVACSSQGLVRVLHLVIVQLGVGLHELLGLGQWIRRRGPLDWLRSNRPAAPSPCLSAMVARVRRFGRNGGRRSSSTVSESALLIFSFKASVIKFRSSKDRADGCSAVIDGLKLLDAITHRR